MNSEEVFPPSNRSGSTIEVLNVQCDEAQEAACTDSFLARYKQHQMDDVGVPHPERYTDPISDGDVDDGPEDANNTHNNPSVNQVIHNNNSNKVHEEESGGDFLLCSDSPTSAIMSADRNVSTARSSNNNNNKIKMNTHIVVSNNELLRPTSAEGGPRRRCNIPSKRLADSPRRPSLSRTGSPARRAQNNNNNNNNSINNRSHSQRRSGSLTAPRSGRRSSSVATSASAATHDKTTGGQVLTLSPEMLRGYVAGLVQHHRSTLAVWTERVTTAELYRDKPTRTGGRPAAARPQDRGFLERAQRSVAIYAVQLADTKALLTREHELYSEDGIDDDRPAFGKHASAGPHHNHRSKAVVEWRTYCLTASGHLEALLLEVRSMQQRVDGLLAIPSHYDPYNPIARDDGWSATRRSGSRQRSATPSRRSSISRDERGHEMLSPQHPYRPQIEERRDSVMRGSAVIRPGSEQRASGSGWERSPSRSQAAAAASASASAPPPPQSGSSAAQISAAAARILHPDTRLRDCYCPSSPYDRTSPYGRLSPARTSSPSRVSATHHQPLPQSQPQPSRLYIAHEAVNDDGDGNGQRADKADDAQLTLIPPSLPLDAVRQEEGSGAGALELETYSSPRGPAVAATPLPHLSDERRTQLLLVIEQFEKNPLSLRKSDLRYARECFSELFGPQRGLRQYCSWVDELALAVIRQGH